ncbi:MAG: tRNA (N(6)-L-threonylcarbamoyladenosine(37)-C(2))-methylthiotransferase MtaB [Lachnospiraceae bacterium]|nr:tRNA (N(6)-L-threonylcarbamoyladenosine(37)-C(2))-methylthiotransferase MtaB [Lachnospiraceae bacterium]
MNQIRKVGTLTLGCKVNQYETDAVTEMLENAGYKMVPFEEEADVYIINTCSVTNVADKKSMKMIRRAKKKNPDAVIVAMGCFVQAKAEELENAESIDILIGNNKKKEIVSVLEEYFETHNKKTEVMDLFHTKDYEELSLKKQVEHTRAYIKVQDGCNQFCSYCIIPYTRGRARSRKKEQILEEIKSLGKEGYKEVVLTGIHLSSYGKDLEHTSLLDLIQEVSQIEEIKRIRLGSLEPNIITEEFVKALKDNEKFCPHFHLSLQSGCDETLKRMNRHYKAVDFKEKALLLRKYFDRPALTTDVIVGFPGETEEEFKATYEFLKDIQFYEMHVFKFSPRKGTRAESMENQVPEEIKNQRSAILIELGNKNKKAYETLFETEEKEILIEEEIEENEKTFLVGHTKRYIRYQVPKTDKTAVNEFYSFV